MCRSLHMSSFEEGAHLPEMLVFKYVQISSLSVEEPCLC